MSQSPPKSPAAYATFADWQSDHGNVLCYLSLTPRSPDKSGSAFAFRRRNLHGQCIHELVAFISLLIEQTGTVELNLSTVTSRDLPGLPAIPYDDQPTIMLVRIAAFLRERIHTHQIQLLTIQFGVLKDLTRTVESLILLFQGRLIPESIICQVAPEFFHVNYPEGVTDLRSLSYLTAALRRVSERIEASPKAQWATDFSGFFGRLVRQAAGYRLPDVLYFPPLPGELSLSRCLFGPRSPYCAKLDAIIAQIAAANGEEFQVSLLDQCRDLIPDRSSLANDDGAVALLIMYRCLFHRAYEKFPGLFAPALVTPRVELSGLPGLPARWFSFPREMVGAAVADRTIAELFGRDKHFRAAGRLLEFGQWMPNPIDALYYVHTALAAIQTGALLNRAKEKTLADADGFVCFDDLFALFFGTYLGTGPPNVDLFFIAWFIGKFAPRESLSVAFEFARATVEGLAAHCAAFDIEAFTAEHQAGCSDNI
jgi:hypothetical protein